MYPWPTGFCFSTVTFLIQYVYFPLFPQQQYSGEGLFSPAVEEHLWPKAVIHPALITIGLVFKA